MYLWLKAAHITSLIVWVSTLLCLPPLLSWLACVPSAVRGRLAVSLRRRVRTIANIAMLGTWGFGLTLMTLGNWAGDGWMQLKLVLVFLLSGAHGMCSAHLRRFAEESDYQPPGNFGRVAAALLVAVACIALLVTVKPG